MPSWLKFAGSLDGSAQFFQALIWRRRWCSRCSCCIWFIVFPGRRRLRGGVAPTRDRCRAVRGPSCADQRPCGGQLGLSVPARLLRLCGGVRRPGCDLGLASSLGDSSRTEQDIARSGPRIARSGAVCARTVPYLAKRNYACLGSQWSLEV